MDNPKDSIAAAAAVARGLTPEITPEQEAQMRDRIAREFFGEGGIPPHLQQGWAVLEDLRKKRVEVGYPMPPGGCMTLGRESVIAGCMAELHVNLATLLNIPSSCIKLRLERKDGKLKPLADVAPPKDWVIPVSANSLDPKAAAEQHIAKAVGLLTAQFNINLLERLDACDKRRTELDQEISPFKEAPHTPDGKDSSQES